MEILDIVKNANIAKIKLMGLGTEVKNKALEAIAVAIETNKEAIFTANKIDLESAKKLVETGEITEATYGRLKLDENKMRDMIAGIYDVMKLEDPVNKVFWTRELDNNLILKKISCPIGVIGIIFEARPDVIAQISALTIKSGNAVILKGGTESNETNSAIYKIIVDALKTVVGFPENAINLLFSREDIKKILEMDKYIDLIIPRGSNSLVKFIQENTKIPVLGHASGVCHIFVEKSAKFDMVKDIIIDAKTQYPTACNAVETVLVDRDFPRFEELKQAIIGAGIEIKTDGFGVEYSDNILTLAKIDGLDAAIEHINTYGSGHTDSILTEDKAIAEIFMNNVDSAGVFHNVSTRFSDGFRFGFGAEVGISTNKTHARGPVGLDGLCIYKYKLVGNGEIVGDYASGKKTFKHKDV